MAHTARQMFCLLCHLELNNISNGYVIDTFFILVKAFFPKAALALIFAYFRY